MPMGGSHSLIWDTVSSVATGTCTGILNGSRIGPWGCKFGILHSSNSSRIRESWSITRKQGTEMITLHRQVGKMLEDGDGVCKKNM